jgi:hypothetical protein
VLSRIPHKSEIAAVEADNIEQTGKAGRRRSQITAMS